MFPRHSGGEKFLYNTSPAIIEYDLKGKLDSLKSVIKMQMEAWEGFTLEHEAYVPDSN